MEIIGYVTLLTTAFLASTILPLSSEAILSALIFSDGFNIWLLVILASFGNIAGALLNWFLGRYCLGWRGHKLFPFSMKTLGKAENWFNNYGQYSLLLAWVPSRYDANAVAGGGAASPLSMLSSSRSTA